MQTDDHVAIITLRSPDGSIAQYRVDPETAEIEFQREEPRLYSDLLLKLEERIPRVVISGKLLADKDGVWAHLIKNPPMKLSSSRTLSEDLLAEIRRLAELDKKCPCCTGYESILELLDSHQPS